MNYGDMYFTEFLNLKTVRHIKIFVISVISGHQKIFVLVKNHVLEIHFKFCSSFFDKSYEDLCQQQQSKTNNDYLQSQKQIMIIYKAIT